MPQPKSTQPVVDLVAAAPAALDDAARQCGLQSRGARLLRLFATAVYHLPAAEAVARIAMVTSLATLPRLTVSVQVTRWLTELGFPTVEPLPVDQPVVTHGCVVTFWRYLPQTAAPPSPPDLGHLLRRLHSLQLAPVSLPPYRPLGSLPQTIQLSKAIGEADRNWLMSRCGELLAAYDHLTFELPPGMIHGDAYRGNLLRDGGRVVLADWDAVSFGPREIDLIPTFQAIRFGLPGAQRDAFAAAYGYDLRTWPGYEVLREMRELSTLRALLRDGHVDAVAQRELRVRLRSLRSGDDQQWTAF